MPKKANQQQGGDPTPGSPRVTLLRLHPSHETQSGNRPPEGQTNYFFCIPLPWCDGRCVQGPGTYSPQHSDLRLLAIPTSWSRVADSNPDYEKFYGISSTSLLGNPLYSPLQHVCSPGRKGHDDLTSSPPSSGLSPAVSLECPTKCWQLRTRVALVAGLNPTSHDTS
eukprot:TRINITY_DN4_c0_g1_i3.p3 TRINITY_DN4_c0_g1~~TRINITY_DN4_c0_g1_i3.p3  ORF type:complete len:167 (-),score=9.37 TRINITY_DN4_c0_g1_i3:697-1197(-)